MSYQPQCCRTSISTLARTAIFMVGGMLVVLQVGCDGGTAQVAEDKPVPANRVATLADPMPSDWPQIRGIAGAGVSADQTVEPWEVRPKKAWSTKVGAGYSSPIVFGDHLFIVHRQGGGEEPTTADLLLAETGKFVWRKSLPCKYGDGAMDRDPGPKATPAYDDGKLFVYDPAGVMFCLDATNGETVWQKDLAEQYGTNKGFFGVGSSPIVCGQNVVVNVGGRDAAVVALDKNTGEQAWVVFDDRASYSSPVQVTVGDKNAVVVITRLHVIGIDSENGSLIFKERFGKTGPTAVGAMPVLVGDHVFVNAAYNVGAKMLALSGTEKSFGEEGYQPKTLWSDQDAFASQYSTPVLHEGLLYGTTGREDHNSGAFRCFDPLTGEVKWTQTHSPLGHSLLVGSRIVYLDHLANLRLIEASPEGYNELAHFKIYFSPTKTIPAFSNGRLYTRSDGVDATLDCWKLN